ISAILATTLLLPACGMSVDRDDQGRKTNVDIRTPFGNLDVRTDVHARATGLPLYPRAPPLRETHDPGSANVNIGNSYFGVKVVAAKFEHDDAPEPIVDYYNSAMKKYGDGLEGRGEIHSTGHDTLSHPVCNERRRSNEIQLVAGT